MREETCNLNLMVLAIPTYLRERKHKVAPKEKKQIHISEIKLYTAIA